MPKKTFSFRLEESVALQFKQFVLGKYGKIYEVLGEELQNAITHWMSEQGLEAHTNAHKINPGLPSIQRKIDGIIAWLRSEGYTNQFSKNSWEKACVHTVGADERTVKKYLRWATKLGKIKHYAGSIWEIV